METANGEEKLVFFWGIDVLRVVQWVEQVSFYVKRRRALNKMENREKLHVPGYLAEFQRGIRHHFVLDLRINKWRFLIQFLLLFPFFAGFRSLPLLFLFLFKIFRRSEDWVFIFVKIVFLTIQISSPGSTPLSLCGSSPLKISNRLSRDSII